MPIAPAEAITLLLERVTKAPGSWPPKSEQVAWEYAQKWRAFAEGDADYLKAIHPNLDDRQGKRYRVDHLPGQALTTWADSLVGEELRFEAADDGDAEQLEAIVLENGGLTDDVHEAVWTSSGEGEVYSRIVADTVNQNHPTVEWFGRDSVIPLWLGRRLIACAIWTQLDPRASLTIQGRDEVIVWRHLEVHAEGIVSHHLYAGTESTIGQPRQLVDHPQTAPLQRDAAGGGVWNHGLPMLVDRIRNRRPGQDRRLGRSDLELAVDQFWDLNEALNVAADNTALAGRKRAVVPEHMLDAGNTGVYRTQDDTTPEGLVSTATNPAVFQGGDDILVHRKLDDRLGHEPSELFTVLEYSYDPAAIITHKRDLVETALTRMGLTPQGVGVMTDDGSGLALTGTALKIKLFPQLRAAQGKWRPYASTLPEIMRKMQLLDALPVDQGGFGVAWVDADKAPSVETGSTSPVDEIEQASVDSQRVSGGTMSKKTAIRRQHPEWSDEQVDQELADIKAETPAQLAPGLGLGLS